MADEQVLVDALVARFPELSGKVRLQRERRVWVEAPDTTFAAILAFCHADLKCTILCTITGLDEGEHFAALYHLAREDGVVVNIKRQVPRAQPRLATITATFPVAELYERELVDLFGIEVTGLPPGNRYPLPENWPDGQHPLRKDWSAEQLDQALRGAKK